MAEEKRSTGSGSSAPPRDTVDKLGTDWGDDWESAFQAEGGGEATGLPAEEILFEDEPAGDLLPEAEEGADGGQEVRSDQRRLAAIVAGLAALPGYLSGKFAALTTLRKLMAGGGLLALLLIAGLLLRLGGPAEPPQIALPEAPFRPTETQPPAEPLLPDQPPGLLPPPTQPHRLSLTGFFIPLDELAPPGDSAFIRLDLTLGLRLPPGEEPDRRLEPQLRDTIYRFYRHQDRETLRRYSLARGEMLRDLREWLDRHHPELAIDTISFDRYWIK